MDNLVEEFMAKLFPKERGMRGYWVYEDGYCYWGIPLNRPGHKIVGVANKAISDLWDRGEYQRCRAWVLQHILN